MKYLLVTSFKENDFLINEYNLFDETFDLRNLIFKYLKNGKCKFIIYKYNDKNCNEYNEKLITIFINADGIGYYVNNITGDTENIELPIIPHFLKNILTISYLSKFDIKININNINILKVENNIFNTQKKYYLEYLDNFYYLENYISLNKFTLINFDYLIDTTNLTFYEEV